MIQKLDNKNRAVSKKIRAVFQASYAIEARLLNAKNFPPLQRTLEEFLESNTAFFGVLKNDEFAGVIEISEYHSHTHINSLVVEPKFFRQGIASKLMQFVIHKFEQSKKLTVETGVLNTPACQLYKNFNFKEVMQWDTDHGVRKIQFECINNSYKIK